MSYLGTGVTQGTVELDSFTGNGSTTDFTLTRAPVGVDGLLVSVDGVVQDPGEWSLSGTTLSFSTAPHSSGDIRVWNLAISASAISDGAITIAKLAASVAARGGYGTTEARLSLTSGTPVPTADVTGAGTVYLSPDKGEVIMLYTGSAWEAYNLNAVLSVSVPDTTTTPFDIFLDYNGGSPALAVTNWTNDTTRATALTTQDGVYVQSGNTDWK